jgi:hypothetical protein
MVVMPGIVEFVMTKDCRGSVKDGIYLAEFVVSYVDNQGPILREEIVQVPHPAW